ncbi:hypothetical protein ACFKHW_26705 [Bradyrhizobium lupini]|uniref:hypothetical protein n=1 Tax=Rhizobium lupini TaxID=136996 RepID=UPI0036708716
MLSTMLIKNAGDQEANWMPSNPPDRPQPNNRSQGGYSTEGEGKDQIEQPARLVGICGLIRGSI